MEELVEFRKPDGSTYFAKFPESEADILVLPAANVSPAKGGVGKVGYLVMFGFFWWLFNEQVLRNVGKRPRS